MQKQGCGGLAEVDWNAMIYMFVMSVVIYFNFLILNSVYDNQNVPIYQKVMFNSKCTLIFY